MSLLILLLLVLTVPGAGLVYALRLDACRTATAIGLSLAILVLALAAARTIGLGVPELGYLLAGVYLAVAASAGTAWSLRQPSVKPGPGEVWLGVWVVPVITLAAVGGYTLWAGPYTEVPADAWRHMQHINVLLDKIAAGDLGVIHAVGDLFDKFPGYWYPAVALALYWTGTELQSSLTELALANTLLITAAVYAFAAYVFRDIVAEPWRRHFIAAAAVFFFITHFGISVFSYVRYYVFGPTFLNYIVYLAAVACVLRFIRMPEGGWRYLAVAAVLVPVAAMVHNQEGLFIIVMSGAMVLAELLRLVAGRSGGASLEPPAEAAMRRRRLGVILALGAAVYLGLHGWAYVSLPRNHPLAHGVMADIQHYLPFLQNLYVLKPTGQFYQVITVWGVLVYVLFLARLRTFAASPYLVAGMAMPVLTVFNPVFTDLFLRFAGPPVLYRMCYMIPLPLVGGYFLVRGLEGLLRGPRLPSRAGGLAMTATLLGLLLPYHGTYFISSYSKIYTLGPVAAANDHRIWRDLLEYLASQEPTRVLTDPTTGYVINSLTHHRYPGYKFYGTRTMGVARESYDEDAFKKRRGWLVVVNRRDGAPSATGRHGRHWPEDIMKVSRRYSDAFTDYIENHPQQFERLWQAEEITVYRITGG